MFHDKMIGSNWKDGKSLTCYVLILSLNVQVTLDNTGPWGRDCKLKR